MALSAIWEVCYLYEGQVVVTAKDGQYVGFGAGDLVAFLKGLKCTWNVKQAMRKRFNFE